MKLAGKTLFITGATRGIGKAIALRAAADGANVAVLGKTSEPHPKLKGTVHETVREIEAAGGRAIACVADVRHEEQVLAAVTATIERFGGIDVLVNNASAISLTPTAATEMKRFDLMQQVKSRWYAPHLAYTLSKMGMSLCVLGLAEELKPAGIAVNGLWPRTAIATAAVEMLLGGQAVVARSRRPEIVADAAHAIITRPSRQVSGRFFTDEEALAEAGVTDLSGYAVTPGAELAPDFFL
jgi:citronellol/citronellal dehydrogenase